MEPFGGTLKAVEPVPNEKGLRRVDAVGGAFLLVPFEALNKLGRPFFVNREAVHPEILRDEFFRGEDIYFCDKCREAGIPMYVDLDLKIGHLAQVVVSSHQETNQPKLVIG